jgi:hypothetical protein
LQANERQSQHRRRAERQFGLAHAGHAFDQHRFLQVAGHVKGRGDPVRSDVANTRQPLDDALHRGEGAMRDRGGGQE